MNWADILHAEAFRIALIVAAGLFVFWFLKNLLRWALIFLISSFLIWHFWLA